MSSNDISKYEVGYTDPFNFKSLNHLVLLEKLFDELHQKIQTKLDVDLKVLLEVVPKISGTK